MATRLTPGQRVDAVMAAAPPSNQRRYTDPSLLPIASPWAETDLTKFVWRDIFGTEPPARTREAAMALPALSRARNIVVSTICRLPLRQLVGQTPTPEQPSWITQTGDGSSPQLRMAWTVDDLIFHGWSLWWRNTDGTTLASAPRVNFEDWDVNDDNQIEVNGTVVRPEEVIVFPGLHEGILSYGASTIEDVRNLYKIVKARLLNPAPQLLLKQTAGDPLTKTERAELIADWALARQGANGGVGFVSEGLDVSELGGNADAQLMVEARNAAAVDLCRLVGVTASRADAGTAPGGTLRYETTTGRNEELVDFDLGLYMTPVTARLSMDDVTPPGQRVDFDLSDFVTPAPSVTGPDLRD